MYYKQIFKLLQVCSCKNMSLNYIQTIEELNNPTVRIKNKENVNNIIANIISAGKDKLQVISDFDRTLTKQHENGKLHISSFGLFCRCPSISQKYLQCAKGLSKKYYPIEVDPTVPHDEKKVIMKQWWSEINEVIKGETVSNKEIAETTIKEGPALRDGTVKLFDDLNKANIPVLVFSAGLGDSVLTILKHCNILHSNVKVFSNFLYYNEDGVIQGFKNYPLIHVLNKNEFAIKDVKYLNFIKERSNVLLMGDSPGDSGMADGVHHAENILKIGFLYDNLEENLSTFMDAFDIVLVDDQTMEVPQAILNKLF